MCKSRAAALMGKYNLVSFLGEIRGAHCTIESAVYCNHASDWKTTPANSDILLDFTSLLYKVGLLDSPLNSVRIDQPTLRIVK